MAAATIKAKIKTPSMSSELSGALASTWPGMLAYLPDADARDLALAEAKAVHERLTKWELDGVTAPATEGG